MKFARDYKSDFSLTFDERMRCAGRNIAGDERVAIEMGLGSANIAFDDDVVTDDGMVRFDADCFKRDLAANRAARLFKFDLGRVL